MYFRCVEKCAVKLLFAITYPSDATRQHLYHLGEVAFDRLGKGLRCARPRGADSLTRRSGKRGLP